MTQADTFAAKSHNYEKETHMNISTLQIKYKSLLLENFIYYLVGFLLIFCLKLFYSRAASESLSWILAPTALCVSLFTGIPFTAQPGAGYVNHSLRFIIAPSCSGLQFMIVVTALLLFSFVHRTKRKITWSLFVLCFSFLYTILVNSLRITLAIYIPLYFPALTHYGVLTPERLHTLIGTVIYLSALLIAYRAGESICRANTDKTTPHSALGLFLPAFWYFFIVLGLPFLNHAYRKEREQFTEYTALIVCSCLAVACFPLLRLLLKALGKQRKADACLPADSLSHAAPRKAFDTPAYK